MKVIKLDTHSEHLYKDTEVIVFALRQIYLCERNFKEQMKIKDFYTMIAFSGELFDPNHPNADGYTPNTNKHLDQLYKFVKNRRISLIGDIDVMNLAYKDRIVTREKLSENSIILGICHDEDNTYTRFIIKDLKKFYTYAFYSFYGNYNETEENKWTINKMMLEIPELIDNTVKPITPTKRFGYNEKYIIKAFSYIENNVKVRPNSFISNFLKRNGIFKKEHKKNNVLKLAI
jgi:hypothetical protein